MALNILEHVALAYQPIWGKSRQMVGVRLLVRALDTHSVDAQHLLKLLDEEWTEQSPVLQVAFADPLQLLQALKVTPRNGHWLEIPKIGPRPSKELSDAIAAAVALGNHLVQCNSWDGSKLHSTGQAPHFRHMLEFPADQTAQTVAPATVTGQICTQVRARELADRCLDLGRAWGVCGWPANDVLRQYRYHGAAVDKGILVQVQQALMHEQPMDRVEDLIHQDLVLTYRLLRLVNSAVFGANRQVDTTRQALLLLGQRKLRDWLLEQLPGANVDVDMQPVRQTMVLRARLMEYLMDAGAQSDLATEIFVTGMFSFLPDVTNEPLALALKKVPVSEDVHEALLAGTGRYAPYLHIARCMEQVGRNGHLVHHCVDANFPLDKANRALIRMLAQWPKH